MTNGKHSPSLCLLGTACGAKSLTPGPDVLVQRDPKCRHDHRLKQQPGWKVDQQPDGTFRWTTPSGRQYVTEPTCYPV